MKIYFIMLSITIVMGSWTVGLLINNAIRHATWYDKLSHFNFIRSEKVNKYLGLHLMRNIIRKSFWRHFNQTLKITKRPNREQLLALRNEMTCAEIGHFVAFIVVLIVVAVFFVLKKSTQTITLLLVLNVFLNLYPSLIQQLSKRRLDVVLKRPGLK